MLILRTWNSPREVFSLNIHCREKLYERLLKQPPCFLVRRAWRERKYERKTTARVGESERNSGFVSNPSHFGCKWCKTKNQKGSVHDNVSWLCSISLPAKRKNVLNSSWESVCIKRESLQMTLSMNHLIKKKQVIYFRSVIFRSFPRQLPDVTIIEKSTRRPKYRQLRLPKTLSLSTLPIHPSPVMLKFSLLSPHQLSWRWQCRAFQVPVSLLQASDKSSLCLPYHHESPWTALCKGPVPLPVWTTLLIKLA